MSDADRDHETALDYAATLLGSRLEPHLQATPGEPENAADFKRIATIHAFADAWPRTDHIDHVSRALVSVAITATLGTHEPLRGQVRIALTCGATREQIVEVLIHLATYAGVARAFDAYGVVAEVFARQDEKAP